MGDLIHRYMVCGIQYSPVELHVGPEATKRNLKRMKDYFEYTYEQYSYCDGRQLHRPPRSRSRSSPIPSTLPTAIRPARWKRP